MEASVARQFSRLPHTYPRPSLLNIAGARAVVVLLAYDYVALSTNKTKTAVAVLNALVPPAQNDGLIGRTRPYFGPHT